MKKIFITLFALILAACDRPIATAVLRPDGALGDTTGAITLRIYDVDNVIATIHGQDIKLVPQEIKNNDIDAIPTKLTWDCTYMDQTFSINAEYNPKDKTVRFNNIAQETQPDKFHFYDSATLIPVDFKDSVPTKSEKNITNNCDTAMKKCENGQEVYLSCEQLDNAVYKYITLVKCPDNNNIICLDDGISEPQVMYNVQKKSDPNAFDILYSGSDGVAIEHIFASDAYFIAGKYVTRTIAVSCNQTVKLAQHKICARHINKNTMLNNDGTISVNVVAPDQKTASENFVTLTQEQALSVSPNWDYKNIKLYNHGTAEHEKDACEALQKLEKLRSELNK